MKKKYFLVSAALATTAGALITGCTDQNDNPANNNQPKPNGDGRYNILFITTDQEAYMEQYPAGSDYAARERLRQLGTSFEKHYTGRHITETCMLDNTNYAFQPNMSTDLWLQKDVGRKFVQTIEAAIGNLTRRPAGLCVHEAVCGHCAVVEKNGDLYRCDRYVFPEYRIGNILNASLYDMMQTNRAFGEYKLDSLPSRCLHCDVADLCFGGCPKDRLLERMTLNGIERRNYLCDGYRLFFRYFRQHIHKIIK